MMIPEFLRFYHYTVSQTLNEYAIVFFTLVNSMYQIQAKETLNGILAVGAGMSGKEASSIIDDLKRQARGLSGIVNEVRQVKGR